MVRQYRYHSIKDEVVDFQGKNIIIWGISISGLEAYIFLTARGANVIGYTDSFANGKDEKFANLPVYTFSELQKMKNMDIYISTIRRENLIAILDKTDKLKNAEIYCRCSVYGPYEYNENYLTRLIDKDRREIEAVRNALCDEKSLETFDMLLEYRKTNNAKLLSQICEKDHLQYFPGREIFTLGDEESFVDAGAYNGETSYMFSEHVGGKYKHIYMLEPDKRLYWVTREYVKLRGLHDTEIIKKGAYSHSTMIKFQNDFESGSSNINMEGDERIDTISIDEMLNGRPASYIKMDIEGAEVEALEGCKDTIAKYRPKLAISIYHKEDDLWKIPFMILSRYPFYKLYVRHYTTITTETVMYAVPD